MAGTSLELRTHAAALGTPPAASQLPPAPSRSENPRSRTIPKYSLRCPGERHSRWAPGQRRRSPLIPANPRGSWPLPHLHPALTRKPRSALAWRYHEPQQQPWEITPPLFTRQRVPSARKPRAEAETPRSCSQPGRSGDPHGESSFQPLAPLLSAARLWRFSTSPVCSSRDWKAKERRGARYSAGFHKSCLEPSCNSPNPEGTLLLAVTPRALPSRIPQDPGWRFQTGRRLVLK